MFGWPGEDPPQHSRKAYREERRHRSFIRDTFSPSLFDDLAATLLGPGKDCPVFVNETGEAFQSRRGGAFILSRRPRSVTALHNVPIGARL